LDEQLADAAELLGLAVTDRMRGVSGPELAAADGPVYVIADAFHLPWLPYYGHKHVEHSFVVEPDADGVAVEDAYHNDTQWGRVRPSRRWYSRVELADVMAALPDGAETVRLAPQPLGPAPEPVRELDEGLMEDYLRAYAEHGDRSAALERFMLETWLLARSRRLHGAYAAGLTGAGALPGPVRDQLARWDSVVEHAYLAFRRVARGRAEPPELLARAGEALHADAVAFGEGPGETARTGRPVYGVVRSAVGSVLGVAEHLLEESELTEFPEFSSLRMVEIVERLEHEFSVEFAPGDLVPERLHRIDDLCGLVLRTLGAVQPGPA
jgi:acyl carrier protein